MRHLMKKKKSPTTIDNNNNKVLLLEMQLHFMQQPFSLSVLVKGSLAVLDLHLLSLHIIPNISLG